MAVGGGHQGCHLAVRAIEEGQGVESVHDDGDGLADHVDDGLVVHLDGLALAGRARHRQPRLVLETLPVARHHFVAQDRAQNRLYLKSNADCLDNYFNTVIRRSIKNMP